MKKGELSINMIILIAIGLLVLVILAFGIANGWFGLQLGSKCPSLGGSCKIGTCDYANGENDVPSPDGKQLCPAGQYCCTTIG